MRTSSRATRSPSEVPKVSEWRECWTPEEYADMRDFLTPQQLDQELSRAQAKREHYRVAETFGLSGEEAAFLRIKAAMITERPSPGRTA
jgi:2-phospho-L-lactate transferase/gluconeogenesis factor (CofD/UPF0052 family)